MARLYRVIFDTQRNRRYITWGYFVYANNQKEAKEKAFHDWHSSKNTYYPIRKLTDDRPHMYHMDAARMPENELDRNLQSFYQIQNRYASWG